MATFFVVCLCVYLTYGEPAPTPEPEPSPDQGPGPAYPCPAESYSDPALYGPDGLPTFRPLIIAHRGASGMYPEHTALGYRKAAEQGADLIECDLAITKDHKFICLHEPYLALTTDIAKKAQFAGRKTTYNMDDDDENFDWNDKGNVTNWFSFDFTLAELQTLRKRQANEFRDPRYDWTETVVTLEELVNITREVGDKQKRTIGIYPELKHSHSINKILSGRGETERFEDHALKELNRLGFSSSDSPCYLQAFEISSLEYVRNKTDLKLVFLTEQNLTDTVWDRLDKLKLAGMGVDKGNLVTPGHKDDANRGSIKWGAPTDFLDVVHEHGLKAHCFTFRNEWMKLYWEHGQDPYSQLEEFLELGTDGYFSDFPLTIRRFLHYKDMLCSPSSSPGVFTSLPLVAVSLVLSLLR
eukprot:TRINITY_DN2423_c0_g1_i4.p1 TRINITY_DN2423_c0_g1~~TRINITY_DN2423_c0_g1_i4.p1  ORF type:complete len:412 (-),score=121.17 TRINITY_DN2423_c0_g1_i4:165-1400(-)